MKQVLFSLMVMMMWTSVQAQTRADKALVLQECIDLKGLQEYYPKDGDGGIRRLYIVQDPVALPENMAVAKDGKFPAMLSKAQLDGGQIHAYFRFSQFDFTDKTALVVFVYHYEETLNVQVTVELKKENYEWFVTKSSIEKTYKSL
ncbi:MAG TPA: hypothetical protein PLX35_13425 [Cyclobacteriaceae bacterium]|nr:hypothetical protein [Cyclobacteriaceae bacterium]